MWIGSKVSKMPYLTIFNKLIKTLHHANVWGYSTIRNPEHASFYVVYQLLDSIVNLCTKLEVFSFKLTKFRGQS